MPTNRFTRATCDNCSAPLKITGEEKVVICEYCLTSHVVPQNLLNAQSTFSKASGQSIKSLNDDKNVIIEARENYISDIQQQISSLKNEREKIIREIKELKTQKPKNLLNAILLGIFFLLFSCLVFGRILVYISGEESPAIFLDIMGAGFAIFLLYRFVRQILKIRNTGSTLQIKP